MTTTATPGIASGGKPINLGQLQGELASAGVSVEALGLSADRVYSYDAQGQPTEFASADQAAVAQAITGHMALRDKTDAEYATEFQNPATSAARKQEIRDITAGLLPREQAAITQAEWDAATKAPL